MKVKYIGPVYEGYVPGVGKFIRGRVYDFPDEVALTLLKNTGFILVAPPVRKRPRRRVRAPRPSKPKVEEKPVEELPKEEKPKPVWNKPKVEEDLPEEEVKIEIEETPKEV